MRAYRILILVAALLVVVLVPWWLTWDPDDAREGTAVGRETAPEAVPTPHLRPAAEVREAPAPPAGTQAVLEGNVTGDPRPARGTAWLHRIGNRQASTRFAPSLDGAGRPIQAVDTTTDGTFRFPGVGEGHYVVRVRTADGRRGSENVEIRPGGGRTRVTVAVFGGDLTLRGRTLRTDGSPWQGHVLVTHGRGDSPAWAAEDLTSTDAEGRFAVGGLRPGPVLLAAIQPGVFRWTAAPVQLPHEAEYVLVVDEGLRTLRGVVLRSTDEAPVAGASVLGVSHRDQAVLHTRAVSAADGTFSVQRFGLYLMLEIERAGYAFRYEAPGVDLEEIRVLLAPLEGVSGRVVEAGSTRPVAGARVLAVGPGAPSATLSDEEGRFSFGDIAPGTWFFGVFGGGWHSTDLAEHRGFEGDVVVPAGGRDDLVLEVARAPTATGRVLDADGRPVPGARVWPDPAKRRYDSTIDRFEAPVFLTDADGRFLVDTLVTGLEHCLRAEASGFAPVWSESFRPEAGTETSIDLAFPPPRMLHARVLAASDEEPVPGASVSLRYQEFSGFRFYLGATSDTGVTGHAVLGPLVAGEQHVTVDAEGFVPLEEVLPATETGIVERTWHLKAGFDIAGRVLNAEGEPVANLFLEARKGEIAHRGEMLFIDGSFRFTGLEAGTWRITVHTGDGSIRAEADVEAGTEGVELRVEVSTSKALVVHVLDPAGKPVPRFEAWFGQEMMSVCGDYENGRFEKDAGDGAVWIEIRKPRSEDGTALPYAPALIGPLTGDEEELTVRLQPGLTISGVVRGPDGEGVAGLKVGANPLYRPDTGDVYVDGGHAEARTDDTGRFTLIGLHAGRHKIQVRVPSRYAPAEAVLAEAGTDDVSIELEVGVEHRVRVVDVAGEPVVGARVQISRQSGGGLCFEQTDANGDVLLIGLASDGRYGLEVRPPGSRPTLGRIDDSAWRAQSGTLMLPAARVVRGRVVDDAGAPVKEAQVYGHVEIPGHYPGATTKEDGSFVLGHLPDAPLRVWALTWGEWTRRSKIVEVRPGDDDVVELALGWERVLVLRIEDPPQALLGQTLVLSHPLTGKLDVHAHVRPDGTALFHADPEARYDLHFWLEDLDRQLSRQAIEGDAGEVRLALAPAATISGRVHAPADVQRISVSVKEAGMEVRAQADAEGRFTLRGLPPGTWKVRAWGRGPSGEYEGEARLEAGKAGEIHLRPVGAPDPSAGGGPPPAPMPLPLR